MRLDPAVLEMFKGAPVEKFIKVLEKEDRKRRYFPEPELTQIEADVLAAIADGRVKKELEGVIRLYASKHNYRDSYRSVVRRLINKFEAFTLAHVVYKAMKVGLIE